jgi:hypothetical protein
MPINQMVSFFEEVEEAGSGFEALKLIETKMQTDGSIGSAGWAKRRCGQCR